MTTRVGNVVAIIGYVVALGSLAALMWRYELLAYTPMLIVIQVLAVILVVWARVAFGFRSFYLAARPTKGTLVTTGPYRFWRHPIYAGIIFFIWAGVADYWSARTAFLAVALTVGLFARMFAEERLLGAQYEGYAQYAAGTKRLVPWVI